MTTKEKALFFACRRVGGTEGESKAQNEIKKENVKIEYLAPHKISPKYTNFKSDSFNFIGCVSVYLNLLNYLFLHRIHNITINYIIYLFKEQLIIGHRSSDKNSL